MKMLLKSEGTPTYPFPCAVQLDRTIPEPPIGINLIGSIGATGIGIDSWPKRTIVIMARLGRSWWVLPEPGSVADVREHYPTCWPWYMIEFAGNVVIASLGERCLTDHQPDALSLDSLYQPQRHII
jgi:hypothetical protein